MIALWFGLGADRMRHGLNADNQMVMLQAAKTILVPALSLATVPHDVEMEEIEGGYVPGDLWLVQEAGTLYVSSLLVNAGPIVVPSPIQTVVFNLSNTPLRLKKGEAVSALFLMRP